jgi:hypothetical protein
MSSSKLSGGRYQSHLQYPPRGPPSTSSSNSVVDATRPTNSAPRGACHRRHLQTQWWTLPDPLAAPPGGLPLTSSSTSVADAVRLTSSAPQGACHQRHLQPQWWTLSDPLAAPPPQVATIHVVFNLDGGRCQTHQQHLQGPPSRSSSNLVEDAGEPIDSTPRGPIIDVIIKVNSGRCRTHWQHPPGERHRRCIQLPLTSCSKW